MVADNKAQLSPSKLSRVDAIRQALLAAEETGKRQHDGTALGEAAIAAEHAQRNATTAEEHVEDCLADFEKSVQKFDTSIAYVREAFSPPPPTDQYMSGLPQTPRRGDSPAPSTPSRSKNKTSKIEEIEEIDSEKPLDKDGIGTSTKSIVPVSPQPVPGGVIRFSPSKEVVEEGSNFPAYIVYSGPNRDHRMFYAWRTIIDKGLDGAKDWMMGNPDTLYKGFPTKALAHRYYQECEEDGVFDALKVISRNRRQLLYIVTRGVVPGVYDSRFELMRDGLQWKGGEVTVFEGNKQDADSLFQMWKEQGRLVRRKKTIGL
ncbi:hypothetical protein VNI00_017009 [Paramarasmius palmivorus]|uniref:Uncharacterized protein n=1 Tax=Paramarasmius palmivorus TaxID=297713 RepID=A0AAW0B9Y8_9AGAR